MAVPVRPTWHLILWLSLVAISTRPTIIHASEAVATPESTNNDTIIRYALSPLHLQQDLRTLTDEIGGRVSGTRAMSRAVDWAVAAFGAAGLKVHTESYELPTTWEEVG